MLPKILIIHNPRAGQKKNINFREELTKWTKNNSGKNEFVLTEYNYVETEYGGHAIELAKKGISDGFNVIVAAGGDGTVNEIASTLVNTDVVLGIIPMGSGNGLARHNLIPMNLEKAFSTILKGNSIKIDAGNMNGRYFFCAAGVGFDATVSEKFASSTTRGLISYIVIALEQYFNYKSKNYMLKIDNIELKRKAFFITIANANQFGNHAYIAPQALIDDGKLEICILKPFAWYKGFSLANRLFNKTIQKSNLYESFPSREVEISTDENIVFHTDGEINQNSTKKVSINIIQKALNIIVPL